MPGPRCRRTPATLARAGRGDVARSVDEPQEHHVLEALVQVRFVEPGELDRARGTAGRRELGEALLEVPGVEGGLRLRTDGPRPLVDDGQRRAPLLLRAQRLEPGAEGLEPAPVVTDAL